MSTEGDDRADLPQLPVKKKRNITTASYVDVKRWVTGDRAEMPEEDIERELFEEARALMHLSGLRKLPGHRGLDSDFAMWKKANHHSSRDVDHVVYRCPMRHRCKCKCSIRVSRGPDFVQLS